MSTGHVYHVFVRCDICGVTGTPVPGSAIEARISAVTAGWQYRTYDIKALRAGKHGGISKLALDACPDCALPDDAAKAYEINHGAGQ